MPSERTSVRHLALVGAGFALLALVFAHLGPARIVSLLIALGFNFPVIVLLFTCHECVRAVAISRFFTAADRPGFQTLLRIRFLGEAIGAVTRTGTFSAEPMRAWILAGHTGSGTQGYAASAGELIVNSCTSALVSVAVTGYAIRVIQIHGPLLVLCRVLFWSSLFYASGAVVAVAFRIHFIGAILRGLAALPLIGRRLKTDPDRARSVEDAILDALTRRPVAITQVFVLECLAQFILVFEIYWTIRSMGVAVDLERGVLVEVLTKAANFIQFVGVTETGYALIFDWLRMTATVGFALSLVKELRSLAAAGVGLMLLKQSDRRWWKAAAAWMWPARHARNGGLA